MRKPRTRKLIVEPNAEIIPALAPVWNPQPLPPPAVDPEFYHLGPIQRSAESIRYSILSFEFWISKNGQVREWLRHNSRLAAWLVIPAILVLPLMAIIVVQAGAIVAALIGIAGGLAILPIVALLAFIAFKKVIQIIQVLRGAK